MANNRISIKCCCGDELFVAKRMNNTYYTMGDLYYQEFYKESYLHILDDFFEKHSMCGDSADHFKISYEFSYDDDKYNKLIEAVETIKEFIESCEGSTTALITKSGEMLCTDWGYFEDGLDEIEKYARGTE